MQLEALKDAVPGEPVAAAKVGRKKHTILTLL